MTQHEEVREDYFRASLEAGSLVLEPFCACGEALDEDYYCRQCERHCKCHLIRCRDQETLNHVQGFIEANPKFRNFRAVLNPNPSARQGKQE